MEPHAHLLERALGGALARGGCGARLLLGREADRRRASCAAELALSGAACQSVSRAEVNFDLGGQGNPKSAAVRGPLHSTSTSAIGVER